MPDSPSPVTLGPWLRVRMDALGLRDPDALAVAMLAEDPGAPASGAVDHYLAERRCPPYPALLLISRTLRLGPVEERELLHLAADLAGRLKAANAERRRAGLIGDKR